MSSRTPRNRYYRRSYLSERTFRALVRAFALDLTATAAAELTGVSRRTVNTVYGGIRARLAEASARTAPWSVGDVEVDEAYFGARRVRGKPGRSLGARTPVIGLRKRDGKVYAEVVPNCSKAVLQRVIRGKVPLASVIHSDSWAGYDGLVDVGYAKHYRVRHAAGEYARRDGAVYTHVNGIESFWAFAKQRLVKFYGIAPHTFHRHLKECEWRFNTPRPERYRALLALLRQHPL
jgi:transposase-like protein